MEGYGTILLLPEAERRVKLNHLERSISKLAPSPSPNRWKQFFAQNEASGQPTRPSRVMHTPQPTPKVVSLFHSFKKRRTTTTKQTNKTGVGLRAADCSAASPTVRLTSPRNIYSHNLAIHRLVRFRHVLRLASTAPWANKQFAENEAMTTQLIAAHLALIVGADEWKAHKGDCFSLLDSTTDLGSIQNVCWITNR